MKREDLKPGEILCSYCTAKCCKYFALPIETPTDWEDFDHIRWYLIHGGCAIFVDEDTWFLMVYGDCEHLDENNMCGIYEDRPQICGEYSDKNCEYENDGSYDRYFESAEQIWEYAEAVLPPRKWKRKPEDSSSIELPVVNLN